MLAIVTNFLLGSFARHGVNTNTTCKVTQESYNRDRLGLTFLSQRHIDEAAPEYKTMAP